jgi:uncharacterized protein
MREGIRLATDLYIPARASAPLPAILIRTAYNKAPFCEATSDAHGLAGQGYAVAVQDTRGKFTTKESTWLWGKMRWMVPTGCLFSGRCT